MKKTLFSVIIPSYKMGKFIGEALESVSAQTCRDWEVIVVDDCAPDDGTERIVRDFAKTHPEHRVEFIRHEKNTGVSGARNTALSAAAGEWAAFLDPDDLWLDHHLSAALDVIKQSPDVSLITAPVIAFNEEEDKRSYTFWTIPSWKIDCLPASLAYHNFIQPSATIVRASLVKEVGGFDTSSELQHIEDYDLWIRLAEHNARFIFSSKASCYYRKHSGAATHDDARMERLHQNLTKKHLHFFVRMHSILLQKNAETNADLRNRLSGPIMRIVTKIDGLLSRWFCRH